MDQELILNLESESQREVKRKITAFTTLFLSSGKIIGDMIQLCISPHDGAIRRLDYSKRKIFLYVTSPNEVLVKLNSCKKEPETVEWIETFLKPGDVFYDIGANVGAYSLVAAKFFNGKIQTYAFEPAFITFNRLCKNIMLNRCAEHIIPLPVALADTSRVDTFYFSNLRPGGTLNVLSEPKGYDGEEFKPLFRQTVLAYSLDDLISEFNLPVPQHIKLDIDGQEWRVLEGAKTTLE